jgi:hypothetical protein
MAVFSFGQKNGKEVMPKDSLIIVKKNPSKGFYHTYIVFIPKGTAKHEKTYLLVEPNNTGKVSDSIEVHEKHAVELASVRSLGNNISTELKIPLLVPVFPRPASQPYVYTHALDRDVMTKKSSDMKRPDLQLLAMIEDARNILQSMDIETDPKVFMNGFSASATFVNRFSFLHPEKIKALAIGGFNGKLMIPAEKTGRVRLPYPIGLYDFTRLFGRSFDQVTYSAIPQYIYMGQNDDNDAVQYDDAYSKKERNIINSYLGKDVQSRYAACQKLYREHGIQPIFKTYENVGHWTTSNMNLDVILFFLAQMRADKGK